MYMLRYWNKKNKNCNLNLSLKNTLSKARKLLCQNGCRTVHEEIYVPSLMKSSCLFWIAIKSSFALFVS